MYYYVMFDDFVHVRGADSSDGRGLFRRSRSSLFKMPSKQVITNTRPCQYEETPLTRSIAL